MEIGDGGPVRRQICFPLRRDPSCSNLTTALRDVPSLSSKPASRLMLGRLVKKLGLGASGDRLNVRGSLSHSTRTLHLISAGLHCDLSALTNHRSLVVVAAAGKAPSCPFRPQAHLAHSILTILPCGPRQTRRSGEFQHYSACQTQK